MPQALLAGTALLFQPIFCDILPVVQFGWIMTLGVIVSMVLIYWLVPAVMVPPT